VSIYSSHSRRILEDDWESAGGKVSHWQIKDLDLSGTQWQDGSLSETSFTQSVLNDSLWMGMRLDRVEVTRSDLNRLRCVGSQGHGLELKAVVINGLSFGGGSQKNLLIQRCVGHSLKLQSVLWQFCSIADLESTKARLEKSMFQACRFSVSSDKGIQGFQQGTIKDCLFMDCDFQGQVFAGMALEGSTFVNCRFKDLPWEYQDLNGAIFSSCTGVPSRAQTLGSKPWTKAPHPSTQKLLEGGLIHV
jgi:uncharacterized protein YjbI with pentapeptide repeats